MTQKRGGEGREEKEDKGKRSENGTKKSERRKWSSRVMGEQRKGDQK